MNKESIIGTIKSLSAHCGVWSFQIEKCKQEMANVQARIEQYQRNIKSAEEQLAKLEDQLTEAVPEVAKPEEKNP